MILKETLLDDGKISYDLKCEKSNKLFAIVKKEKIGNVEKTLCDEEVVKFKKWIEEKGYAKTDCWCKHLGEYINTG